MIDLHFQNSGARWVLSQIREVPVRCNRGGECRPPMRWQFRQHPISVEIQPPRPVRQSRAFTWKWSALRAWFAILAGLSRCLSATSVQRYQNRIYAPRCFASINASDRLCYALLTISAAHPLPAPGLRPQLPFRRVPPSCLPSHQATSTQTEIIVAADPVTCSGFI